VRALFIKHKSLSSSLLWLLILLPMVSHGHEAWLQPYEYLLKDSPTLRADIRVGQMFKGSSQIYNSDKFVVLDIAQKDYRERIKGRLGDLPAITHTLQKPGLYTLGYQSSGSVISYGNWEKFETFAIKQGLSWVLDEHRKLDFPEQDFDETFFRYAKSLVSWHSSHGQDTRLNLPFEMVALNNPYLGRAVSIEIELVWNSKPYANGQITVFRKPKTGDAVTLSFNTDSLGRAIIPIEAGHQYLLNAVHMLATPENKDASIWQSHWASLTFEVPQ